MVIKSGPDDFPVIYEIINDAAMAYKSILPHDKWHEPFMTMEELKRQIEDGVEFWKYSTNDQIVGVMGLQDKGEVTLIRHAYVRSKFRGMGAGGQLLQALSATIKTPILIGTWTEATWAISFYKKHGFYLVTESEKDRLLRKYWNISEFQIQASVVLSNVRREAIE